MRYKTECNRCGICCKSGGPALHKEDVALIEKGILSRRQLITIRQGELVRKPDDLLPRPAQCELIKITGTGQDWQCLFYGDNDKGCLIYQDRPLSCQLLKCWDTTAVEDIIEKDTLNRFDIVDRSEPIFSLIEEHEAICPTPDLEKIRRTLEEKKKIDVEPYEYLVNSDIQLRSRTVQDLNVSLAEELFYFGRPLFQQLLQLGVQVTEEKGKLKLRMPL